MWTFGKQWFLCVCVCVCVCISRGQTVCMRTPVHCIRNVTDSTVISEEKHKQDFSSSGECAMIWEGSPNSSVKTIKADMQPRIKAKGRPNDESITSETHKGRGEPNKQPILSISACVCVSVYLRASPEGMTLMLHTHCFAKLMDLLECLQWAWKPVLLYETGCPGKNERGRTKENTTAGARVCRL